MCIQLIPVDALLVIVESGRDKAGAADLFRISRLAFSKRRNKAEKDMNTQRKQRGFYSTVDYPQFRLFAGRWGCRAGCSSSILVLLVSQRDEEQAEKPDFLLNPHP